VEQRQNDVTSERFSSFLYRFSRLLEGRGGEEYANPSGKGRLLAAKVLSFSEPQQRENAQPPVQPAISNICLNFFNVKLDHSQRAAVELALSPSCPPVVCIQGPPGTGKTTTLCEILLHLSSQASEVVAEQRYRCLIVAASNLAVDNLLERVSSDSKKYNLNLCCLRLGHPTRALSSVYPLTMEAALESMQGKNEYMRMLKSYERAYREGKLAEANSIRRELRNTRRLEEEEVFKRSQFIFCTTSVAASDKLRSHLFDAVIVEEAGQVTEVATLPAIVRGKRVIMGGDHFQLPPFVQSETCTKKGLGKSMFERIAVEQPSSLHMLTVQYRAHAAIMQTSSNLLYHGRLEAGPDNKERRLEIGENIPPLHFVDTVGEDEYEESELVEEKGPKRIGMEGSKMNKSEAEIVMQRVQELLDLGVNGREIAVITPYRAQTTFLREIIREGGSIPIGCGKGLEVDTVDGFQGREKDVILLTFVRSNKKKGVGFLDDIRRLNVAVTRARRHVFMVGDSREWVCLCTLIS